jgi:L-ascorbate metabolism protein UlaG (beta-lactamase superfamily)
MKITKIFHSCVLLEDDSAKILIDPGAWVFEEKDAKISDFSDVDAVLVTHEHPDHYYPEALKEIARQGARIITNKELATKMVKEGISAEALEAEKETAVGGLTVKGVHCDHGSLVVPTPANIGFLIDGRILHPGDCISVRGLREIEILFLPMIAPWMKMTEGVMFAKAVKPKIAVPIHEGFVKEPVASGWREVFSEALAAWGVEVKAKNPGESFEI